MGTNDADPAYTELLTAIERARSTIDHLEAEPASAKRDHALATLHERLRNAILRLNQIDSDNHHN